MRDISGLKELYGFVSVVVIVVFCSFSAFAQQSTTVCSEIINRLNTEVGGLSNYIDRERDAGTLALNVFNTCKSVANSTTILNQNLPDEAGSPMSISMLNCGNTGSANDTNKARAVINSINSYISTAGRYCEGVLSEQRGVDDTSATVGSVDCIPAEDYDPDDGGNLCNASPGEAVNSAHLGSAAPPVNIDTTVCAVDALQAEYDNKCEELDVAAKRCCHDEAQACALGNVADELGKGATAALATLLGVATSVSQVNSVKDICQNQKAQATALNAVSVAAAQKCDRQIGLCTDACGLVKDKIEKQASACKRKVDELNQRLAAPVSEAERVADTRLHRFYSPYSRELNGLVAVVESQIETCESYESFANDLRSQAASSELTARLAHKCEDAASTGFVEASVPVVTPLPVVTQLPSVGDGIGETAGAPELSVGNSTGSLSETSIDDLLNDFDEDNFANNDGAGPSGFGAASTGGGGGGGGGVPSTGSLGGGGGPGGSDGGYAPDDKVGSSLAGASGGGGYSSSSGGGYANIGGGSSSYGSGSSKYRKKSAKFDLKKYLPGNKKDPKKAKRGLASKGEISLNVHSSIWDTISTTYKNELGNL